MTTLFDLVTRKSETASQRTTLVTYLNPYSYLILRKRPQLLEAFDEIRIDGIALVMFLKIFGVAKVARRSFDMSSDATEVIAGAVASNSTVYLIGAKPSEINMAVKNILEKYPKLNIVGYRTGYFNSDEERRHLIKMIAASQPDYVICGMGTPLQEEFLVDLREADWHGSGYTCGGFFHQSADRLDYYPQWIDRLQLRWLYRIYKEPRLFKRYGWEYPKFAGTFVIDYLKWKI